MSVVTADVLELVLTAGEADSEYGKPSGTTKVYCNRGVMRGRKSGGTWLVTRADCDRVYLKSTAGSPLTQVVWSKGKKHFVSGVQTRCGKNISVEWMRDEYALDRIKMMKEEMCSMCWKRQSEQGER